MGNQNVKEHLIENVKASKYYSIQLAKSTVVCNTVHFLQFMRSEDEGSVKEILLLFKPFLGHTTPYNILKIN
jgi:hypothetical protein